MRLLEAAGARGVFGRKGLVTALEQTTYTVANWAVRGVSKDGALIAEQKFGCSAAWLLTGLSSAGTLFPSDKEQKDDFARLKTIYMGLPPSLRPMALMRMQDAIVDLIPPYNPQQRGHTNE